MSEVHTETIHVGKRFFRAARWAAALHSETSSETLSRPPSVAQVLGVASLVLEDGGTEREAIAAMLHDAVERHVVAPNELRARFGKKVAQLVQQCTIDTTQGSGVTEDAGNEVGTAKERMQRYLDAIAHIQDASVLRVHSAERLRDIQALVREVRRHGSISFARLAASPEDQLWHWQSLVETFRFRMPRSMLTHELRTAVADLVFELDLETATAAWRVAHAHAA